MFRVSSHRSGTFELALRRVLNNAPPKRMLQRNARNGDVPRHQVLRFGGTSSFNTLLVTFPEIRWTLHVNTLPRSALDAIGTYSIG